MTELENEEGSAENKSNPSFIQNSILIFSQTVRQPTHHSAYGRYI